MDSSRGRSLAFAAPQTPRERRCRRRVLVPSRWSRVRLDPEVAAKVTSPKEAESNDFL